MKLLKYLALLAIVYNLISCQKSTSAVAEVTFQNEMTRTGNYLSKKHKIHFCGGAVVPSAFSDNKNIQLDFEVYRKLTKEDARELMIDCIQAFNKNLFGDESAGTSLNKAKDSHYSFIARLTLAPNKIHTYHPNIGLVTFINGKISYVTYDPEKADPIRKTEEEESYEVALHIVEHQKALVEK